MSRWTAGVDFGGTTIKVGLVSDDGRVAALRVLPTAVSGLPDAFVRDVSDTIERLAAGQGLAARQLRGVGIGAPGPVDAATGTVTSLTNVPGWRDMPLRRRLEARLRCPCLVDNDANVVILGEWHMGAGRRAANLVGLTLGTGVGGGLILNGRLYRGSRGGAGEIGHVTVNPSGPLCGCGNRGCLEAEIGTAAILRRGRRVLNAGAPILARLLKRGGPMTPALIYQAARAGDRAAREVWAETGRWCGVGAAGVANVLNPECLVIAGGVAGAWPFFAPALRRTLRERALTFSSERLRVVRGRLGNRAGILGAAVLVWEHVHQ